MSSTDTTDSSLLKQAMNRPLGEKLANKSVRLKQATEALLVTDAAAGLSENRRSTKEYNKQADRATKTMVDQWTEASGGKNVPQDDDETVTTDLGDRYQEIHNHYGQGGQAGSAAPSAIGSVAKKALPWVLAAAIPATGVLGAGAGALGSWWFNKSKPAADTPINVKDVQSKFKVEVYDEAGKLMTTLPYDALPKK